MKNLLFCLLTATLVLHVGCQSGNTPVKDSRIVANPINLNYRFQPDGEPRREAADPVCEYFNGKYYLFASKSGGYWSSPDLCDWSYIPCKTITTMEHYAPTILVMDDAMYFMSSSEPKIFKNSNPDLDNWEDIGSKFQFQIAGTVDPAFFKDDDGRVYMYWGCSDVDPIIGVEVDPDDAFKVVGEAKILIEHNEDKYGWEVRGDNNSSGKPGYNEGPCMIKYKGKYYLQYASPGTEVRVYGDGLYVADNPLGPYTYEEHSPFSFKPGGFIAGAGHGHTFQDKHGNYWHVATMKISVRHMFERRLGIFPVYISDDDRIYQHSIFTDYPFRIPDGKGDFEKDNLSMGWNLLSYKKEASASSSLPGNEPGFANNEEVETWWTSATGNAGEWWQVDLGETMTVNAIQVNFADQDFTNTAANSYVNYQYKVESSVDGNQWKQIIDRTRNTEDAPHELIVLDNSEKTRYLRITNSRQLEGKFSLSGFRVFGQGNGTLPPPVHGIDINRNEQDRRMMIFSWNKSPDTTGYIINWGVKEDKLNNALMTFDTESVWRFFNRDSKYYFTIDSFNENGITKGKKIFSVN